MSQTGMNGLARGLAGKRVVFVFAGERLGGAERGALDFAEHLARVEGAVVEICALDDTPARARPIAEEEGIAWSCVPTPWVGSRLSKALSLLRVAYRLRRLRPEILVAHTNLPNVVCGLTWRLTGARLCVWNQWDVLGTKRISHKLFRRALRSTPLIVVEAAHVRDWLVEEWGADPQHVQVLRPKVELPAARESRERWRSRLGLGAEDLAVCMLAHFKVGKDHQTLLRAWRVVVDRLEAESKAILLLPGAGNEDAAKALAFDLDLRDYVRFLGVVDDVSGLLAAVDLAVISSDSESLPRGVMEPMYAGVPVVGTDIPGIREAVGEPGRPFLTAPGDAVGLADAIFRLARDPGLRARVGRSNAEVIRRRHSGDMTSRVYARLLADALAGPVRVRMPEDVGLPVTRSARR